MIRSTQVRKKYCDSNINPRKTEEQKKGDVLIGNNSFGKYKGELQLVLNEMPLDKRKNMVAKVIEEEQFLIDYIEPWDSFKFREHV